MCAITATNCIIVCSIENLDPMGVTPRLDHHRPTDLTDKKSAHARRLGGGAAQDRSIPALKRAVA